MQHSLILAPYKTHLTVFEHSLQMQQFLPFLLLITCLKDQIENQKIGNFIFTFHVICMNKCVWQGVYIAIRNWICNQNRLQAIKYLSHISSLQLTVQLLLYHWI